VYGVHLENIDFFMNIFMDILTKHLQFCEISPLFAFWADFFDPGKNPIMFKRVALQMCVPWRTYSSPLQLVNNNSFPPSM
jgi:hypothetical protein